MSLDGMEAVCVKQECDSDGCGDNEAALAALYEDHVVKQELVLGPELLQKPSVVYMPPASVTTPLEAACVKREQGWDSDGHSETEEHELHEELVDEDLELGPVVLKEELELGPVVLQPPDALYTRRGVPLVQPPRMSLDGMEAVCVKQECDSDGCGDNEAALAALYEDHVVKQELVLGPELLQKPSVVYMPPASVTTPLEAACVKREQGWDSDGHSETEEHELHEELVDEDLELGPVVLKEELELGPVVLQPPDALYTRRASVKTEDKDTYAQTLLTGRCSVVLERVLVDLEARTCTIGPQTYSFRLCDQKQALTEITRKNTSSQIRLPTVKQTKSAKTRKPKAPVEEKKAITSATIAKRNSAEIIQKSSDIQEVSPEKPAVSSSSSEVNTLTAETNFKCEKCGKGFNIKSDLEKHLNTHMLMEASTSRKASKFTCKTCDCIFDTKLLLQEHEKSRHSVKFFACDECEYATNRASSLQAHLRTHTGEKPYKCGRCSSTFTQSSHLQAHLRTHTGEKPFKCSRCSSAFSHSCHLQDHLKTHTGEKPFKCRQCSSTFTKSSSLLYHLRTHTGEKPFECNICDYKTAYSSTLKDHLMSRHSGQKPFGCDACSYRGATRGHLRHHMKRRHKPA